MVLSQTVYLYLFILRTPKQHDLSREGKVIPVLNYWIKHYAMKAREEVLV
jgi:hypothetical protein